MEQTDSSARGVWRVEAEELIPGLPNCVILDCIIPRLAWHTRAVLVATSKAWNVALQEPHIYGEPSRRAFDAVPRKGVVLLHQLSEAETYDCFQQINTRRRLPRPHALSILEDQNLTFPHLSMHPTDDIWTRRRLPPIPDFAPLRILHDCGIACVNGKIFVMGGWDPRTGAACARMYMLDIGAGLWRWETMPPMNFPRAFFHCISSAGRIFAVGGRGASCLPDLYPDPDPEAYNVDTQTWELLPTVVLSRSLHYNGVFFVEGANLLVTHGFCITERGEPVRFRRAYDPVTHAWRDHECEEGDDDVSLLEDSIRSKWVDGRRCASKHGNVADGDIALSMAPQQDGEIKRVLMK